MTSFESIRRCTCGCVSRPAFKLSASLLDIMGQSKEISQDLRKKMVDFHKSGSSLGAISTRLKVPRSSVQTIIHKCKHRHTAQEGDAFCLLEMSVLWCESANQSQNSSIGPCEDAGGNRYKSIYIYSKTRPIST